ncbi:UDP-glucose 4-epimerase-like [Halyomorpha halys]|uniref:UDP-glucose 4-epimerase-like n=1 Tax=Halyomorpha halys TaxID=286706 RepID=UPI0006D4ECEF
MDQWNKATVLLTGGAGYIGSHTAVKLLENGNNVVVIDNCSNCYKSPEQFIPESLHRVQELTGKSVKFIPADLLNKEDIETVFLQFHIDCVIHFSGFKSVGESCKKPLEYYRNNVVGSINLFEVMKASGCYRLIYSSSATVYGNPKELPLVETSPTGNCTNPYGWTKYVIETMASNLADSSKDWKVISLRYFNPVGAHESGRIGEDPNGIPNNLMPFISQVAVGKREELKVFGKDYDTKDGTGVRDYIHIQDLADGHVKALERIFKKDFDGFRVYNLGTGTGHSVLEMIQAFEDASGKVVPYSIAGRREGDVAVCYCDCQLANRDLQWYAKKSLRDMCEDTWRWQEQNPNGFQGIVEPCSCPANKCTCKKNTA